MIKEYYYLEPSTSSKEIGIYEQLDVPKEYYKKDPNFTSLTNREFSPLRDIGNFTLKTLAKKTDVLSSDMISTDVGLFVSEKFKDIINEFNDVGVKFIKSSIHNSKGDLIGNYYFMHVIHDCYNFIDYNKSVFVDFTEDDAIVQLSDDEKKDLPGFYEAQKIYLKKSIDLFRTPYSIDILISNSLKDRLEIEKISGLRIKDFSNIEFEV